MNELTEAMSRIAALERARAPAIADPSGLMPVTAGSGAPPAALSHPSSIDPEQDSIDVFISYSMPHDDALAADVEHWLTDRGYRVWRAASLRAGETPHRAIGKALIAARAVVVLWTPASIDLDWIYSEAKRAKKRNKLIPMSTPDIDHDDIPPPFDTVQTLSCDNRQGLLDALTRLGIEPSIAV